MSFATAVLTFGFGLDLDSNRSFDSYYKLVADFQPL